MSCERVWYTTQLATLSFNHSNGCTHSWRFSTFYEICTCIILRFYGPYDTYVLQFFCSFFLNLGFTRACWRSFGITRYLPQPPIVFASPSIDKHGSQLSTAGIRQQSAAAPTRQHQHSKSTRVYHTWRLCRQPVFTACSARDSTTTEIAGPKLIGYTGTII